MIRQFIYTSRARPETHAQDFPEILRCSRRNNPELDLTGLLIVSGIAPDIQYTQIIEGEPQFLEPVIEVIRADTRHTDFRILVDHAVETRCFGGWSMGELAVPVDAASLDVPGRVGDVFRARRSLTADAVLDGLRAA